MAPKTLSPTVLPRLSGWLFITLALALLVALLAPQQLPVSLYKLSLVSLAGVVGYWLDRSLFPYARPDHFLPCEQEIAPAARAGEVPVLLETLRDPDQLRLAGTCMLRRALIVAATMVAMGLGA
ncbi:hypothetical protein HNQ51_001748 [Inhella inkyongensis]|uniref:2/3 transmembrane domain holin n=1 Tax=Inhella inkyongensis TaxID=392593 RepID=A0A840S6M0_9BURK|nr:putative holin [Inhella inkyongensis]MBB5204434.1 hypothetical protein [Inhella inkyongensis]